MYGISQSRKHRMIKPRSITTESHRKNHSQVVQQDGYTTQIAVSACKKTAARTKQWRVGIKLPQKIHKMPQQRRAQFGNQLHIVQTTAGGSNTTLMRQHPELGQAHRARVDENSTHQTAQHWLCHMATAPPIFKQPLASMRQGGIRDAIRTKWRHQHNRRRRQRGLTTSERMAPLQTRLPTTHDLCEQNTHSNSMYRCAQCVTTHTEQNAHISSREHVAQDCTSLCPQIVIIHLSCLVPCRT